MTSSRRFSISLLIAAMLAVCLFSGCTKSPDDHARVALTHGNPEKRTASVEALAALNDQAQLAKVAEYSGFPDTRIAAAHKLTDRQVLADFAQNAYFYERNEPVFPIVVAKISDPQTLADLVRNAKNIYVRIEAACALNDQSMLAKLLRETRIPAGNLDRESVVKAIGKLTDQAALADIVKNGRTAGICELAAVKLTDQKVLAEIARSDLSVTSKFSAIDKLADKQEQQQALAAILDTSRNQTIRMKVVGRLSDQKLLAAIAMTRDEKKAGVQNRRFGDRISVEAAQAQSLNDGEDRAFALAALGKIDDQRILADLAAKADFDVVRSGALEKLNDPQLLLQLAILKDMNYGDDPSERSATANIAWAAFRKINDQGTLADIVMHVVRNDNFHAQNLRDEIRKSALEKITGGEWLARIAGNAAAADDHLRLDAMDRLTDRQALADIAAHDGNDDIVWRALGRLDQLPPDQRLLAGLARAAGMDVRLWAVWRLDDRELLAGIAKNDAEEYVRNAAAAKLAAKPRTTTPENIVDMIKSGRLVVNIRGGIDEDVRNLCIFYRKAAPGPMEAIIPAGTYFVSQNKAVRNMIAIKDVVFTPEKTEWTQTIIPAVDASKGKRPPSGDDTFAPVMLPDDSELKKLAEHIGRKKTESLRTTQDDAIRQAAVWIVTDDTNYNDLHSLVLETRGGGTVTARRMIYELEASLAMQLCEEAGVDIKQKRIWRDREKISAGQGADK